MATTSRILISGASGLIGASLQQALQTQGSSVSRLVRDARSAGPLDIPWHPQAESPVADPTQLEGFKAVIHLSGANLSARRWSEAYKREIVESRTQTTQALCRLLAALKHPPSVFIAASATGIYGNRGDEILTEDSHSGSGFLADTCAAWEASAQPARDAGIRVVHARFGVVLSAEGGALKKMLPVFRAGLGGKLGSGKQWMSWISLPDVTAAILYAIQTQEISGPINCVSPIPVTNEEFTHTLAQALHRPAVIPAPAFVLRLAFGQMADEALLTSTRAIPARLAASGFHFQHPQLAQALAALLP